jgi:hypothetical protein
MLSSAPSTSYLVSGDVSDTEAKSGDAVSQALSGGPVWITGYTGLNVVNPAGPALVMLPNGSTSPPPTQIIKSWISIVDDATGKATLEMGCF